MDDNITQEESQRFMRREFAKYALIGLLCDPNSAATPEQFAAAAWKIADAMIATENNDKAPE